MPEKKNKVKRVNKQIFFILEVKKLAFIDKNDPFWRSLNGQKTYGSKTKNNYSSSNGSKEREVFPKNYPQQNVYSEGGKKHDHIWYDPDTKRSGWTGKNFPRKKK